MPRFLVMTAVALVLPLSVAAEGTATEAQAARMRCGTISSTSKYERARVIAIRGVTCRRARRVARAYDHRGDEIGRWRCFLAHDDAPRLFSCGWPPRSGDIRRAPHALTVRLYRTRS